jgi:ubiquinone/menaquinone biosynthesis C-methylase UbiE
MKWIYVFLNKMVENGWKIHYIGIGIVKELIDINIKNSINNENLKTEFIHADVTNINFSKNKYYIL